MKRTVYILLLLFLLFQHSCKKGEESDMDTISSNRISETLENYREIMESAPNGWVLTYSFGLNIPSGEYTYLISFKNGIVNVSSDNNFIDAYSGQEIMHTDKISSQYKLLAREGVTLSFDTYNSILHRFLIPSLKYPEGHLSDYEFTILSATKEKIKMKGKRYGKTLEMIPLPSGTEWSKYLEPKSEIDKKLTGTSYYLMIGDEEIELSNFLRSFVRNGAMNVNDYFQAPYRITDNGIQFLQPLSIKGLKMQNFRAKPEMSSDNIYSLECTDSGVSNVYIKIITLPLNHHLKLHRWYLDESSISDVFKTKWQNAANGMANGGFRIDFAYIGPSHIAQFPGTSMTFTISDGLYAGYILDFIVHTDEQLITFSFKSNGYWGGIHLMAENLKPLVQYMCDNSPYRITETDNRTNPNKMLLTSENDNNVWLRIEK